MTATLTCCLFCSEKFDLEWGLKQLREVWTKNFKSSPVEEDDVQEDDVEMTRGGIDRVFFPDGKQDDALKKKTRDKKTLEITLETSINAMLSTCDDKGVFTDDW